VFAGIILYVLDARAGSVLNMSAWGRRRLEKEKAAAKKDDEAEKVPVLGDVSPSGIGYSTGIKGKVQYTSPIMPNSAFHIRNRMLSKLGAQVRLCKCGIC